MKIFIFLFVVFSIYFDPLYAADGPCGDWQSYGDQKCFKILDKVGLQNFTAAEATCGQHEKSQLLSIHTKAEQDFLANFLFIKNHLVDNLWIGSKFSANKFTWKDGSNLTYTNWATGSPKNHADYCVQMLADEEIRGKWADEPCAKRNLVVCEKKQPLSLAHMQEILFEVRKEVQNLEKLKQEVQDLGKLKQEVQSLSELKQTFKNLIPIGFIYVQLPKEKAPKEIWSSMTWTDVSSDYAGVFFRVSGGQAATFGAVQEEFAPSIDAVQHFTCTASGSNNCPEYEKHATISIPKTSDWSDYIKTAGQYDRGSGAAHYVIALKFHRTPGEVRPKNMAMKVWKRTG